MRKDNGRKAYFEWLPVRDSPVDSFRAHRKINYGNLADLIVLDTRLEGRDEQDGTNNQDTSRTILGHDQYNWFVSNLDDTTTQWKIIAQQVMIGQLDRDPGKDSRYDMDKWDGYVADRTALLGHLAERRVGNVVALTGDIHNTWIGDLAADFADPKSPALATEFVKAKGDAAYRRVMSANARVAYRLPRRG